jgi:cell division septum initiation protein DivIVA
MSVVELHAGDGAARPVSRREAASAIGSPDGTRPNVSGDLPSLFRAAPMFRRAVAGYDRFQVDTYVEWAEDELATADREREHLMARHLSTRAALDEARELLSRSASGGEFLQVSRRIGAMLATAADEAESIRVEAQADRSAAAEEATRILADAGAEAQRVILETAGQSEAMTAEAGRILDEAERSGSEVRAEADARLEQARRMEQLAVEQAEQIRRQAVEEASAARLQARDDVVRILSTGREERRRADAEAAAMRDLLAEDARARCASLHAEISALEHRRSVLLAEIEAVAEAVAEPVAPPSGRPLDAQFRELVEKMRWRSGSLRAR